MEKIRKEKKYCSSSSDSEDEISRMSSERLRNKLTIQILENKRLKTELRGYKDSQRTTEGNAILIRLLHCNNFLFVSLNIIFYQFI